MEEWPPKRGRKPTKWSERPHNSRETATTADLRKLEKRIGDVLAAWEKESIAEIDTLDLVVGFRTITGETREATATKKRKERPEWHTSRKKPTASAEETAVACLGGLSMPCAHQGPPRPPPPSSSSTPFPSSSFSSFSPFSSFPAFPTTPYPAATNTPPGSAPPGSAPPSVSPAPQPQTAPNSSIPNNSSIPPSSSPSSNPSVLLPPSNSSSPAPPPASATPQSSSEPTPMSIVPTVTSPAPPTVPSPNPTPSPAPQNSSGSPPVATNVPTPTAPSSTSVATTAASAPTFDNASPTPQAAPVSSSPPPSLSPASSHSLSFFEKHYHHPPHKCSVRISALLLVRNYLQSSTPGPIRALYPGSFVDITPSFAFEHTTYIDMWDPKKQGNGKEMGPFFDQAAEFVRPHLTAFSPSQLVIDAHNLDYHKAREELSGVGPYDVLISFDAGLVTQACLDLLKGMDKEGKKGLLVVNDGHGDASFALSTGSVRLIGAITIREDGTPQLETRAEHLSLFFSHRKKPHDPCTPEQLAANGNKSRTNRKYNYFLDDPYAYVFEKR